MIVNSPSNPTGRVFPKASWDELADVLEEASRTHGRRIWLLSDEPYRRIRFDGIGFASPAGSYPWTMIDYSYGKVLLAPGQRLGYLALSPLIPPAEREELRAAFMPIAARDRLGVPRCGHAVRVPALESVSHRHGRADSQARSAVRRAHRGGVRRSPVPKARSTCGAAPQAATRRRSAMRWPSSASTSCRARSSTGPQHFRISLTATMETIERALPRLEAAARTR